LPANKPFVETLGIVVHIDNLETANNNFKTTFSKRSNDTIGTEVFDTKKLRTNMMSTYNDLVDYIVVMARQQKTPYYIDILTAINYGRKYYSDILAKRSGNNDKSKTA
jgi:Family of unknown function (DUF6261)